MGATGSRLRTGAALAPLRLTRATSLPSAVQDPATTVLGPRVLLLGGLDQSDASVDRIVSASAAGSRVVGTLPHSVHDAAATTVDGAAYLFGGGEPSRDGIVGVSGSATPVTVGSLPLPASDVAAATLGHSAYIVGGFTGTSPLDSIVAWRGGGTAKLIGRLPHPLRYAAVASASGGIIVAGGTSGDAATRQVYRFDPVTHSIRQLALLPHPLTHAAAVAFNGVIYVLGGRGSLQGTQSREILAINPASGALVAAGELPVALSDVGAATIGNDVLVAGGRERSGTVSDRLYVLSPGPDRTR